MKPLLAALLLALSGVEGAAQPFLNKEGRGDRLLLAQSAGSRRGTVRDEDWEFLRGWKPWQRRTVVVGTIAGAVGGGIMAARAHSGATAVGVILGGAAGLIVTPILILGTDELYYLWSGHHMEPWNTFRFSFPSSQVG